MARLEPDRLRAIISYCTTIPHYGLRTVAVNLFFWLRFFRKVRVLTVCTSPLPLTQMLETIETYSYYILKTQKASPLPITAQLMKLYTLTHAFPFIASATHNLFSSIYSRRALLHIFPLSFSSLFKHELPSKLREKGSFSLPSILNSIPACGLSPVILLLDLHCPNSSS